MKQLFKATIYALLLLNSIYVYSDCDSHESLSDDEMICCPNPLNNRNTKQSRTCDLCCSSRQYSCGTTIFIPRSQGANTARELVGWQKQLFKPFLCENYTVGALTAEYTRSFESSRIACRLFCTDCLTFSGSQQPNRVNGRDIIADFFGLPTNYRSTLKIEPVIDNFIVDFNFYFGLNDYCPQGFFFRMHIPVTHTRWDLGLDECTVCNKFRGDDQFPEGYMFSDTPDSVYNPTNPQCQLHVLSGLFHNNENCTTHTLRQALSGKFTFGDMTEKWKYGRFSFCPLSKTEAADVDIILGYNIFSTDFSHLALFSQVVVPSGNRPNSKYIFEPIAGNGKHWEFGGGFSTHFSKINDYYDTQLLNCGVYIEGNATYVFKNHQKRSFDFCNNGLLSRYMLLKEFDVNNRYIGRMINGINFATRNAEVSVGYKIDFSFKVFFQKCGWIWDFGYNIWAKDKEKVCIETDCPCDIDLRRFGIKGTEGVVCDHFDIENNTLVNEQDQKLNSTQANATMFDVVTPRPQTVDPDATSVCISYLNPPVENGTSIIGKTFILANSSATPVIISCKDLDPSSAAQPSQLTHKIFTHLEYVWKSACYEPNFGIGAEVEFNRCSNASLNQWGIWAKGGITF